MGLPHYYPDSLGNDWTKGDRGRFTGSSKLKGQVRK
jgi:hypothetical protein